MKHNRFSKWIERLLVLLPLFYVAISSAYVIFNKNAKDSYYGENINESEYVNVSVDDFVIGNTYEFVISNGQADTIASRLEIVVEDGQVVMNNSVITGVQYIVFYVEGGTTPYFFIRQNGSNSNYTNLNIYSLDLSFVYASHSLTGTIGNTFLNYFYTIEYNQYSYLNNVMTYSMSEFNKLGFGKLDFTSWFTNIFMNGNTNNVYVQFVNSYLNYFLMVECVYFIPMILYWFIHFGESVVDRFIRKGDNW